jgi:acetyltransferase-like isoleucine patch superfamily enzyme
LLKQLAHQHREEQSVNDLPLIEELGSGQVSAYWQYLNMFVGSQSLAQLLRYEAVTATLGPMPGALGYFLRGKCYRWILARIGAGSVVGRGVVIRCPRRISIGNGVMIDDGVVLDAKGTTSKIELGNQILLGAHSIISCNEAQVRIGNFVSIGPFSVFACKSQIEIGAEVSIGSGAKLMAGGHVTDDPEVAVIRQPRSGKGIKIENGAWIGTGAIILDGVTVGLHSIVGAGAVVSKDVPPWTVVLGNPARVVQRRKEVAQV